MTTGGDELLRAPLSVLGLAIRVYNALLNNGFSTVGDVVANSEVDLWRLHYLGPASVAHIKAKLSAHGLELRPGPPHPMRR
jgi:DNA-directed RNA polymerase alpha subunit